MIIDIYPRAMQLNPKCICLYVLQGKRIQHGLKVMIISVTQAQIANTDQGKIYLQIFQIQT